jgi:hypothetical protein
MFQGGALRAPGYPALGRGQGCARAVPDSQAATVGQEIIKLMPTDHILALLIEERDRLSRAIEALQGTRRPGRPPKKTRMAETAPGPARKNTQTVARRELQAQRMRAYWARTSTAARRKLQAKRMRAYWAAKRRGGR